MLTCETFGEEKKYGTAATFRTSELKRKSLPGNTQRFLKVIPQFLRNITTTTSEIN